jgi:hypothetical protein
MWSRPQMFTLVGVVFNRLRLDLRLIRHNKMAAHLRILFENQNRDFKVILVNKVQVSDNSGWILDWKDFTFFLCIIRRQSEEIEDDGRLVILSRDVYSSILIREMEIFNHFNLLWGHLYQKTACTLFTKFIFVLQSRFLVLKKTKRYHRSS